MLLDGGLTQGLGRCNNALSDRMDRAFSSHQELSETAGLGYTPLRLLLTRHGIGNGV